jgi:hypothetical protein
MTYGEAQKPRRGQSEETPVQYLNYLSQVAKVREYVQDLVREWTKDSLAFRAERDGHSTEGYAQVSFDPR